MAILQHEVDAVPWLSGTTPKADAIGWPTKSYTLAWDQIPDHKNIDFGGRTIYGAPHLWWATRGITLFDMFAPSGENKTFMHIDHIAGIYGGGSVAVLKSAPFQTCNYIDTIDYYNLFDDEISINTVSFIQQVNPYLDQFVRERASWQFSPTQLDPAQRGACFDDGKPKDYYLTDEPDRSWAVFVR